MTLKLDPNDDDLYFLPLGGSDEIGMNVNLYGYAGQWLMVDLGITFGDDTTPGVDVILPDISSIEPHKDTLCGLLLTHGHEDHIGAVPYLWERLGCPIYCTPFTASLVRRKLVDVGLLEKVELIEIPVSGSAVIGPFEIEMIRVTHSIPEPNMIVLRCGAGTVVHSGDWKFDPTPFIGGPTDFDAIRAVGDEGVLALMGDSTNVFVPGRTGSEAEVRMALTELFAQYDGQGRIAVACFASNVARLESVAMAAAANDRQCALIGRSLWRMHDAAKENGYLQDAPTFVKEDEAGYFPEDKIVLICTGSQGESRAALSRISDGAHPHVSLGEGDICIFSSRQIPGNERAIGRVQNRLSARGVEIITTEDQPGIHVSGHPAREELAEMYQMLRPKIAIPVHGDARHLREHARLAKACQVPETVVPSNGSLIRLAAGHAEIIDWIKGEGAQVVDDGQILGLQSETLRDRRRMLHNGAATVTLVLDAKGNLQADPLVSLVGIAGPEDAEDVALDAADAIQDNLRKLSNRDRREDEAVRESARRTVRRIVRDEFNKRPVTDVHIVRI
ncbi:ribonuclease J [Thalassobaculum sp. OXR-137]|uniref:ribonuclease J n=1 Tax=Thalassobaculum sp. OXR-137 TaxID=3100173 RepID=UPI002AC9876B|nr:ribonuclease J [Thalassobaculum sp. OXR-137]WPZ33287.1 ribonuclease J [Thalassobaculum sp. OXR-137]